MRLRSRRPVRVPLGVAVLLLSLLATGASPAAADEFRWDIVSVNFATSEVKAGGAASALAHDGSQIVLTGSGTFDTEPPRSVNGGGTWKAFGHGGAPAGSGTYAVSALANWVLAPGGRFPSSLTDRIGSAANGRAGLVTLRIAYSDGSGGILVVSCHLPGAPDSMFEGITASKGPVSYSDAVAPVPGVDANRTLFHVLS